MNSLKPSILQHTMTGLALDKKYYLSNADLHFQVEQTIFRVHSYFFTRESPRFRERMAGVDCARATSVHDGRTDKTAIPVKNTSAEDFSHFLWVFYDQSYKHTAPASVWRVILTLSSQARWDFPMVHALALRNLDELSLPLVDRIILYKQCGVPFEHLLPLYAELCVREETLTLEESVRLGWELTVPISQARERLLKGEGKGELNDGVLPSMGAAVDGVSQELVQNIVKSTMNTTTEASSVMGLQEHRKYSPRLGVCDQVHLLEICHAQATTAARSRKRSGSRVSDGNAVEHEGSPSKTKVQALEQAQKAVQALVQRTTGSKRKVSANA